MTALGVRIGLVAGCMALPNTSIASGQAAPADSAAGATVPWVSYEAEQARTNGRTLGPDYTGHTPAREASGRRCVRLAAAGEFIEFVAVADADGVVIRYCVPDAPDGGGTRTALGLRVGDGPVRKVTLTSRYAYLYGKYPFTNRPADGTPRHFWDEVRLMPGPVRRGDVVRLQKDADDPAGECLIDLIDLEPVAPPLPRPADSVSVGDCGARGDGKSDDGPAFRAAIAAAEARHGTVWIPPGRFCVQGPLLVHGVAVRGAGMWHSTLVGDDDATPAQRVCVQGDGPGVTLADFAIVGGLDYRNDTEPNDGLVGSFGTGSTIRNVWVEHTKTGAWLTNSDGLLVEGCRFRDTIADGINVCVGMRNTVVRDCTARGTGDDCFAVWPATYAAAAYPPGHNRFVHCTAQLPFLAQGFSIYGGDANSVEDCCATDIPYGAGLFASTTFPTSGGFGGVTQFARDRLLRTGDADGAIGTVADKLDLAGLRFTQIQVTDSPTDGVRFTSMNGHALADTTLDHVRIVNAGLSGKGCGVAVADGAVGTATLRDVSVISAKTASVRAPAGRFTLVREQTQDSSTDGKATAGSSVPPPVVGD